MRSIDIRIAKDGSTTVQPRGYTGQECTSHRIRALEGRLGKTVSQTFTEDYFTQEHEINHENTRIH
jgi:hypothetical protein